MTDATILIAFALPIVAVLAFVLFRKRVKRRQQIASTCGETAHPGGTLDWMAWHIGPRLPDWFGGNKSPGMPEHPEPVGLGFGFDIPAGVALPLKTGPKVDYVTFNHGPLTGRREIRMRYRLELSSGAKVLAVPELDHAAEYPAQITLYFQRDGDDWTGAGKFESYRWYFPAGYLREGVHEIAVPLDSGWSAVAHSTSVSPEFDVAKAEACCVGFVFGGNEISYGHGMRATGPARFIVEEFTVQ